MEENTKNQQTKPEKVAKTSPKNQAEQQRKWQIKTFPSFFIEFRG
jgi:hypothetical protein